MTEFERCKFGLLKWTAFVDGMTTAQLTQRNPEPHEIRDFEWEYASLAGCKTPADLVRHCLHALPFLRKHETMRERWAKFRQESRDRYYRRVLAYDRPRPAEEPDALERLYHLFTRGDDDWRLKT